MIRMMEPKEGDTICDPASGSGGFLIRFFEIVREAIAADVDAKYKAFCAEVDAKKLSATEKAKRKGTNTTSCKQNLIRYPIPKVRLGAASDPASGSWLTSAFTARTPMTVWPGPAR